MSIRTFSAVAVAHPAHQLEVAVRLGDELSVEGPGEGDVQHGVAGHLTGQHDAFAHNDLHVRRPLGDSGRICPREEAGGRGGWGEEKITARGVVLAVNQPEHKGAALRLTSSEATSTAVSRIRRRKQRMQLLCTESEAV